MFFTQLPHGPPPLPSATSSNVTFSMRRTPAAGFKILSSSISNSLYTIKATDKVLSLLITGEPQGPHPYLEYGWCLVSELGAWGTAGGAGGEEAGGVPDGEGGSLMEATPLAQDSVCCGTGKSCPLHRARLWTPFLPLEVGLCVPSTFQTGNRASLLKPIRAREWRVLCYEPPASTE